VIRKIFQFVIFIVITSCSEPFNFDTKDSSIDVVDARVSTRKGRSYIRIYNIKEYNKKTFIHDLDVSIISSSGDVYSFEYVPIEHSFLPADPDFVGQLGLKYRLEMVDSEGLVYQSEYDSIPEPIGLNLLFKDSITTEVSPYNVVLEKRAIAAIAELEPAGTNTSFAKIDFVYTYETRFGSVRNTYPERYTLYKSGNDGLKVRIPVGLMFTQNFSSAKTEMFLESMSIKAFGYWKSAQRLFNNDGIILDSYPFPLKGNITCVNCENEIVGFFRTVSESYVGQIWSE
jgi:hypothetical protein